MAVGKGELRYNLSSLPMAVNDSFMRYSSAREFKKKIVV